jgi:ABC-type multidrug transport system fused ATPase/permease subunit
MCTNAPIWKAKASGISGLVSERNARIPERGLPVIKTIRKFFSLLTTGERRKFYLLILAMIFMGFTEIAGISTLAPFLSVVTNPSVVQDNKLLNMTYTTIGFETHRSFVITLGIVVLSFVLIRNLTAALVKFAEIRFAEMRGYRLSRRLMSKYLGHPYVFYLNRNSAELSRNILSEASTVINTFLIPLLELMTRFVTVTAVIIFLVMLDPIVAVMVTLTLGLLYGIIYLSIKKVLFSIGRKRLRANQKLFQLVREIFGGIKDVKLLGKEKVFLSEYSQLAQKTARYQSNRKIIGSFPKYALDSIVFGAMIAMVLYLMISRDGDFSDSIAILGIYAMAGFRLLPALDGIFKEVANLRGTQAVVEALYADIGDVDNEEEEISTQIDGYRPRLPYDSVLSIDNISYLYPGTSVPVIVEQSLDIRKNSTIGLAGPTGCGKTTLVDIILGLLRPTSGILKVDGVSVTEDNLASWQANLGYVPQSIYLCDDTVARNIAFGIPPDKVDMDKVRKAASVAHLDGFIESELPQGYETFVGEQGIRLSGGQRQRIGIARALYHDPEVLVLDEATSALDGMTEAVVMEAIEELAGKKTIILIAHRLSTLKDADTIYILEKGTIVEKGSYDELIKVSNRFQEMAR